MPFLIAIIILVAAAVGYLASQIIIFAAILLMNVLKLIFTGEWDLDF